MITDVKFEPLGSVTTPPNQLSNPLLNIAKIAADIVLMYAKESEATVEGNYGVLIHKGIRQMYLEIQTMYYQMGGSGPSIPYPGDSLFDINYIPPSTAMYYLFIGKEVDLLNTDLNIDLNAFAVEIDLAIFQ